MQRCLGIRRALSFSFRDRLTAIVNAVRRQRPAVVFSGQGNIDLIAAARAMFVQPERIAPRIHRHPLRVANTISPNLRSDASTADKRIIFGDFPLFGQAYHFPLQFIELLRRRALIIFA